MSSRNTTKERDTNKTTRKQSKKKVTYQPPQELDIGEDVRRYFANKGYHIRWIRFLLNGEEDYKNINKRKREGYQLVSPDEIQDLEGAHLIGDAYVSGSSKGSYIAVGDVCLAKIKFELAEARQDYYRDMAIAQENAIDEGLARNNSEHMPFISRNKSTTGVGKSAHFGK